MFKAVNAKCLRRWAARAPWALAPRGQLGPGPRGTLGPGPLGANWARAPGNPWARAQRGQLGPGPKGPQYEPELEFYVFLFVCLTLYFQLCPTLPTHVFSAFARADGGFG